MTIIAMTREMGSRGRDVALGVADRLGLEIIHHELVECDLAKRTHLTESQVHRFLESVPSLWDRWTFGHTRLARYTAEEILELASRGNVLLRGWGAPQLLRAIGHVVSVRVCAPMRDRENELMKRLGITDRNMARGEIERNDAAHDAV